ncbi:MAG: pitrilysin family protein [Acidobacteriota bacterium]
MRIVVAIARTRRISRRLLEPCLLLALASAFLQAQAPDRSAPPRVGPPPELRLPPLQHRRLSNALPVVLLEKHQVPVVEIDVVVKAGSALDPAGMAGLASMTAAMMDEGAGSMDALQLADAIDFLGARVSVSAGLHQTVVSLSTPLSKLDDALPLLADVLLRPTFPARELDRERKNRLTTLLQWHDDPSAIASTLLRRVLYRRDHPYGVSSIGDEQSLKRFRVEDLRRFHEISFTSNNAEIIVVGDVDAAVLPKLEKAFGQWKPGAAATAGKLPEIKQVTRREVYLVDRPGSAQSEIQIGRIGVQRLSQDYYAIEVMNTVLGGSFTSRLNQNLREKHGFSYGAGSYFDYRPLPGPFVALSAVQTAVTDKALVEIMKELSAIRKPLGEQELDRAKNYTALGFPAGFQSVAQVAARVEELVTYDLPDTYFNDYVGRILAVTGADVERVARKYVDPSKVAIVVVGDLKEIEAEVRALNLGLVHRMTIDDVLGKAPVVDDTAPRE